MTCYPLRENNRNVGFICGDLGDPCRECGAVAEFLCDFPVGDSKTCDRPICIDHAAEIGPETHYCQSHHKEWEEFRDSGGVQRELENVLPYRAKYVVSPDSGSLQPDQRPLQQINRLRHLLRGIPKDRVGAAKVLNIFENEAEELLKFITQQNPR